MCIYLNQRSIKSGKNNMNPLSFQLRGRWLTLKIIQKTFHRCEISLYLIKYTSITSACFREEEKNLLYTEVMWLFTPNWLTCERQRSWDWATLPRCTSSSVTVLVCTFIESQSEMLLLFVTFVHKGKHRAAACRRKDLSERSDFCFNQELVVTATCRGFFSEAPGRVVINENQIRVTTLCAAEVSLSIVLNPKQLWECCAVSELWPLTTQCGETREGEDVFFSLFLFVSALIFLL